MDEFNNNQSLTDIPAPKSTSAISTAGSPVSHQQRLEELLAAKLADPDPKRAVLGSAAIEALEFTAQLKTATLQAYAQTNDPAQRQERLMAGMRLHGATLKLAEKLL